MCVHALLRFAMRQVTCLLLCVILLGPFSAALTMMMICRVLITVKRSRLFVFWLVLTTTHLFFTFWGIDTKGRLALSGF